MKKEIADKWVAALRSGEYKQGKAHLRTPEGFCCLGVLCDLHAKENGENWQGFRYQSAKNYTPYVVTDWAGLACDTGSIRDGGTFEVRKRLYRTLADANDEGVTFDEIADFIEQNHEKL